MIAVLLVLLACAAPWAFGALEPSWESALCLVGLSLITVDFVFRARRSFAAPVTSAVAAGAIPRSWMVALALLPVPAFLALIPMPHAVGAVLRPGGARLLDIALPNGSGGAPLSLDPHGTRAALALAMTFAGVAWIVTDVARRRAIRTFATAALVLSGTALSVFALVQDATQTSPPTIYWHCAIYEVATPFGPFVNRNHFAGAMEILAGVTAGAALAAVVSRRRVLAALIGLALVTQLAALAASQSRGGVIGAAAAFLWLVWYARRAGDDVGQAEAGRQRRRVVITAVIAVVVLVGVLAASGILSRLATRIDIAPRSTNRFLVQRDSLAAFADQPVFGTGPGTFAAAFPAYQRLNDARTFSNGHSDWTQLLMETGLLGVLCGWFVLRALRDLVRRGRTVSGPARFEVLGCVSGVVALVVHGFFDVNLHVPSNALLAVCALSLASAASLEGGDGGAQGDASRLRTKE